MLYLVLKFLIILPENPVNILYQEKDYTFQKYLISVSNRISLPPDET